MTHPKAKAIMTRLLHAMRVLSVVIILFIVIITVLHAGFHVCPFHLPRFQQFEIIPVIYGSATMDGRIQILAGKAVPGCGGNGIIGGICPHCKWPAKFYSHNGEEEEIK